ncbi:hypothetical protein K388_05549 [Streptomyces sp. KhCrAH-43]|uniref:hypothetical protein n=1 Tax=unclassified Streptomyces TaxID=2593676 RepID=UPI000376FF21|nr:MULTISPECIES: hypothetical protein [unclassified Streptomyces]MYX67391.1 hypothetical protein [Streptomyces sp. SID8373]RAJ53762.1 hypothetical protein K388_05549 [Streptomyces sp. KhCrAH-43]
MSSWSEERRRNQAAEAEQHRLDQDAAAERRMRIRREDDERRRANRRADKAEARAERQQRRRDKRDRRRERTQAWAKNTRPGVVYQRGTLALVAASALASLPAQVAHFAGISLMLLPLPFALEGAAWVMAAGVAYADEKRLPAWVRWLLRGLCLSAAGYAAAINYGYGAETSQSVGFGLAAVSLLGPLFFEVRQWVTTLTADAGEKKRRAEAKARARHEKNRYSHHKHVVKLARRLVSAAPYGALAMEDAFTAAWEIFYGTATPGMTPALHAQQLASRQSLTDAMDEANGGPISARSVLLQRLYPVPKSLSRVIEKPQVVTDLPPASKGSPEKGQKGVRRQPPPHRRSKGDALPFHPLAKAQAADTARKIPAVNGSH